MANTFRLINNAIMPSSSGTPDALYTAGSGKTAIILGLTLANVHTSQVTASVTVIDSSNSDETSHIIKDVPLPVGSSIEIMSGNKIVVEAVDTVTALSDVNNSLDVALTIMEIT